ncbi:hypothetical protein Pan241w_22930 [Gimesia alba]|uniref:Uncharacterized protein n=1 Tax=Gimesia alba TaxID=2527973 RepID=A0A517REA7_9PLAN|nr:hypothetical protein Pan241w_22930 [Gimesia alba]
MIYALTSRKTASPVRKKIARAIQNYDSKAIEEFVTNHTIVHVENAGQQELYCIYCCIPVFTTTARPPRGEHAQNNWHFEHEQSGDRPGECVGKQRQLPLYQRGLGIRNPEGHGCYFLLGCQHVANRHYTDCHTISVTGQTYCHLAISHRCIP